MAEAGLEDVEPMQVVLRLDAGSTEKSSSHSWCGCISSLFLEPPPQPTSTPSTEKSDVSKSDKCGTSRTQSASSLCAAAQQGDAASVADEMRKMFAAAADGSF